MEALSRSTDSAGELWVELPLRPLAPQPEDVLNLRLDERRTEGSPAFDMKEAPILASELASESRVDDRAELDMTVSVVVPCKNDARYLAANLESILSQDYPQLECIVVDGGSTDETPDLLERYGDRIQWVSEPDRGAFDARAVNRGWQLARGEIVAWLNADDLWQPGAVRAVVDAFKTHPDVDVVYGTAGIIDETGQVHGDLVPRTWDLEYALRHCDGIIFQPAAFIRRSMLEQVGWLYPVSCHDHDLWLRIARAGGTFLRVPDRLAMDRVRADDPARAADIAIPGKIGLTKRFFADPGLPLHLQELRRPAMSGAYRRALDYLRANRPVHWARGVGLASMAVATDPRSIQATSERVLRPVRAYTPVLRARTRSLLERLRGAMVRLARLPVVASRRMTGQMVERVFARGNRRLATEVRSIRTRSEQFQDRTSDALRSLRRKQEARLEGLERSIPEAVRPLSERLDRVSCDLPKLAESIEREQQRRASVLQSRIDTVEHAIPQAIQPLADRVESIAADIPKLVEGIHRYDGVQASVESVREQVDRESRQMRDALEVLRHEQEALRDRVEAALDRPPASVSSGIRQIYGTPPTLRRIPGWHANWGLENGANPFIRQRAEQWSSLRSPVAMQWFADLLVMIWPGNELSRVLFLTGNFDPNELTWISQTLTEGMTVIDVGAHMGIYSMIASKLVGETGAVVAVEPSSREFQRLTFHVTLNDLRNVRCLQEAASDAPRKATLKVASERNSGRNTFGEFFDPSVEQATGEPVRMRTIDAIVAAQGLQRVDFIKVDVEGHELKVLAGASETLTRFRPRVLIEVFEETLRAQGASVDDVLISLEQRGYALHEFSDTTGYLVPLSRAIGNERRSLVALPMRRAQSSRPRQPRAEPSPGVP